MQQRGRILVVDDDLTTCEFLDKALSRKGYEVLAVTSAEEALLRLPTQDFDVMLTDIRLDGMDGLELCRRSRETSPELPILLMTGFGAFEDAVEAIRVRAHSLLLKPIDLNDAVQAIEAATKERRLRYGVSRLREHASSASRFHDLVGGSVIMHNVYQVLEGASHTDATVLVSGESGTGKEVAARSLHKASRRHHGPFVAINCAAVPESLLESELFGHVRGAFTDAKASRPGLFLQANRGTLFLDEIGDMPLSMQAKLLRVLQERRVRPVGGTREVPFDARIVAATNRDLRQAVVDRSFREDLFFRLNVIPVLMPPLRHRGNDVLLLAHRAIERTSGSARKPVHGLSPEAAQRLLNYPWPGNVRELENCIESAVALTRSDTLRVEDLPGAVASYAVPAANPDGDINTELVPLEEVERRHIFRVLKATGGNRSVAARILGLDRKTLYRKLDRWQVAETQA